MHWKAVVFVIQCTRVHCTFIFEKKKQLHATIDQKMLRWVKKTSALLQNSVREQQDESNTTVSDINSNSDSNSLHAKVKRVETEESILNQIVTDTDSCFFYDCFFWDCQSMCTLSLLLLLLLSF